MCFWNRIFRVPPDKQQDQTPGEQSTGDTCTKTANKCQGATQFLRNGGIDYYQDLWARCSKILPPITDLVGECWSTKVTRAKGTKRTLALGSVHQKADQVLRKSKEPSCWQQQQQQQQWGRGAAVMIQERTRSYLGQCNNIMHAHHVNDWGCWWRAWYALRNFGVLGSDFMGRNSCGKWYKLAGEMQ